MQREPFLRHEYVLGFYLSAVGTRRVCDSQRLVYMCTSSQRGYGMH